MTIYEFINTLENEIIEINQDIKRLEQKEQKKEDDQKAFCIIESVLNNRW